MTKKLVFRDEKNGYKYLVYAAKSSSLRCTKCFRSTCSTISSAAFICNDIKKQLGTCNKISGPIYYKLLKAKPITP